MMLSAASPSMLRKCSTCRAQPAELLQRRASLRPFVSRVRVVAAATEEVDAEAELEKRLEKLRKVKGATPYGQGKARTKDAGADGPAAPTKPAYDFTGETVFYEGNPALGDLVVNIALGTTLLWLPLTFAAIGRAAFMKYRFTDKRFSIQSSAPWKLDQTDVAYQEVQSVITVGRGVGLWGDMVVTLNNGDKVEIRALERFKELEKYIVERRDALAPKAAAAGDGPAGPAGGLGRRGGEVTAEELMGAPGPSSKPKGFA